MQLLANEPTSKALVMARKELVDNKEAA